MQVAEIERWTQAQELLDELLQASGPEAVTLARDRAERTGCAAELESLLSALDTHSALDESLDEAIRGMAAPRLRKHGLSGRVFDRWTLGEELGRGGMSVVYHAHRSGDGFEQHAALKILSLSFASQALIDSFLRERRILSELQHPGIARLIDGGITPEGSPYLVMEHVDGVRIDHWCRDRDADAKTVVRLVEELSRAVAYAQRHLVIHRDINASNVLVNERGRPVLIDFGIAGLMGTGDGQTMHAFTPTFAAPEQIAGEASTTATDVFAIGRLLKSLLPERFVDTDLRRLIEVATHEDPEQRYANARNLADDLQAWLDRRPLRARGPSLRYRAARFVDRHRWGAAASALLVVAIIGGTAVSLWQARIAAQERDLARAESARAGQVTEFLKDLFRASDPDQARGRELSARELLDQGAHQVRTMTDETPELKAEMLLLLGELYRELGVLEAAEPLLEQGLELADRSGNWTLRVTARRALAMQWMESARHEEALALAEEAEQILSEAGQIPGREHALLTNPILFSLAELGRLPEAVARGETALAAARGARGLSPRARFEYLYNVANVMLIAEHADQAEALLLEAAAMKFEHVEAPSTQIALHSNLAGVFTRKGELEAALRHDRIAVALAEEIYSPGHTERARKMSNLASTLNALGRHEEAERAMRESLAIYEQIYPDGAHPRVAAAHNNLGRALQQAGDYAAAEPHMARARELAASLFGTNDPRYAIVTGNLGTLQLQLGNLDRAEELLGANLSMRRSIHGPEHRSVGDALSKLAALRLAQGRETEALALSEECLDLFRRTDMRNPRSLVTAMTRHAQALASLRREVEARVAFSEALLVGEAAGIDAGTAWPELLSAHAEFLVAHADPTAPDAVRRAFDVNRTMLGENHPETLRVGALAGLRPAP